MKNILPGWKTNIVTVILSVVPILGLFGIQIEPETVTKFIADFSVWLQSGFGLLGAAGLYFRQLGKQ